MSILPVKGRTLASLPSEANIANAAAPPHVDEVIEVARFRTALRQFLRRTERVAASTA